MLYICTRYPENNLFTLKELIPIEDYKAVACEGHRFVFCTTAKVLNYANTQHKVQPTKPEPRRKLVTLRPI